MDTPKHQIAIVVKTEEGYEIISVTEMTDTQLTANLSELGTLRQENEALRQTKAYHEAVTLQNNADLRAMFDVLNRTGILRQNEVHITAFLKKHVRKIIDDYDFDRSIFGRLENVSNSWKEIGMSFFKNTVLKFVLNKISKK